MNLIEQLGGYECAKAEFNDPMYEDGELYTIKATGTRFFKHNLADALLEYRRQHNIFEVGDKVVSIDRYSNDMIFTVAELTSKNVFTSMEFGEIAYSFVRHATDEEIKAGRRL